MLEDHGIRPTQWRLPGNGANWWTGELAAAHGLDVVGFSADPRDWTGDDAETMLARVQGNIRPGRVLVLHDAPGSTPSGPTARTRSSCWSPCSPLRAGAARSRARWW